MATNVASHFYDNYWVSANAAKINLTADTIKLMLLGSGYTPNRSTHTYKSDVVANEISGTGYTAGGVTVGSMAVSVTAGVNDVQTVGVGSATAGTFTLTLTPPGGSAQTTAAIAYNATAATVQSSLLALTGVAAGSITVTGSAPTWTVTFTGDFMGAQPITLMTGNGSGLTGGSLTITHTTTGAYPYFTITGANASWPASTFNAAFAALYDATPATDATRPLIGLVDFGGTQSPSNGTLSVTWNASGIGTVTDQ